MSEFDEFEKLRERPASSAKKDEKLKKEDLSKTMVIPRVEDIIEERPLKPATDAETLFAAASAGQHSRRSSACEKAAGLRSKLTGRGAKAKGSDIAAAKKALKIGSTQKAKPGTDKDSKKQRRRLWIKRVLLGMLAACLVCGIALGIFIAKVISTAPAIDTDNIYELLSENSVIYDCDGNVIDNIYVGHSLRTNLEYKDMPKMLIDAFVCIEDKTFWKHHGFNYVRIVGAVVQRLTGRSKQIAGTSTITQQLARNLYLPDTKSKHDIKRKIQEAYYTVQLEQKLSKEQIIEAYLNTIYLGYNCDGVAAAAQAYFSKDIKDLNLVECAQLAALPQLPVAYAPLKNVAVADVEDIEALDIVEKTDEWITYYNPDGEKRKNLVLYYMHEQGKIDDESYEAAKNDSVRNHVNPGASAVSSYTTSYFADYVKDAVLKDLIAAGYDSDTATDLLHKGGLRINSTMKRQVQDIMDTEYDNPDNFPGVSIQTKDKQLNALDSRGKVLLYRMENYFDASGNFVLGTDEYETLENGDLKIYGGKRLNFYKTSVKNVIDYSAEFKNLYEVVDTVCYSRSGGVWNIPAEYKDRDADGNLIISSKYLEAAPQAFTKNEDGTMTLSKDYFTLRQRVRQPQSAMVVMDFKNGYILGMVGGRDIDGKRLFNRATSTRQPGSSIKPLAVYSVALQLGADGVPGYTAATPIDDAPILYGGNLWPKNWYVGYTGVNNLRRAVEQSINACSVNLFMRMADASLSINQLRKMGITSVVSAYDDPVVNDENASALALGGMTKGISPLEMTAAYGTFGNYGVYTEPICYTTVTTKNGDVILSKEASHVEVMDQAVASLMTDILRTTVTNGLGSRAKLRSQPSAGKTGTTSERYDIWFCGLTPQYSAACWIGSDLNIPVNSDSSYAAKLWAKVMDQVGALVPREEFVMKGDFVTLTVNKHSGGYSAYGTSDDLITEKFIKGTEPGLTDGTTAAGYGTATVCSESGYLATPYCPSTYSMTGVIRPSGMSWEKTLALYKASVPAGRVFRVGVNDIPDAVNDLPDFYCPIHNMDESAYPVSPFAAERIMNNTQNETEIVDPSANPDSLNEFLINVNGGDGENSENGEGSED